MNPIIYLAKKTIEIWVKKKKIPEFPKDFPLLKQKEINYFLNPENRKGVFVSIYKKQNNSKELRGCIGTPFPIYENLAQEIIYNAIAAASRDPRFNPIEENELKDLFISVDLLSLPKLIPDLKNHDPKKFGLLVKASDGRSGLLLPDIEGIETGSQQLEIALKKAGILPTEPYFLFRFEVERYKEKDLFKN